MATSESSTPRVWPWLKRSRSKPQARRAVKAGYSEEITALQHLTLGIQQTGHQGSRGEIGKTLDSDLGKNRLARPKGTGLEVIRPQHQAL